MTDFQNSQFNSDKLYNTIKEIYSKIPNTDKNKYVLKELNKIINNIAYTAPEIMHTKWSQLSDIIYTIQNKNQSDWIDEINQIWNKSILPL